MKIKMITNKLVEKIVLESEQIVLFNKQDAVRFGAKEMAKAKDKHYLSFDFIKKVLVAYSNVQDRSCMTSVAKQVLKTIKNDG